MWSSIYVFQEIRTQTTEEIWWRVCICYISWVEYGDNLFFSFFCSLTFSVCVCFFRCFFLCPWKCWKINDIESISWKMPEHVLTICQLIAIRKWIVWKQDYFLHWYHVPAFKSTPSSEQGTNVHNKRSGISVLLSGQPIQVKLFKTPV